MRVAILTQSYPFQIASENFLVEEEAVWRAFPEAEITWVPDVASGETYGHQSRNIFSGVRQKSALKIAMSGLCNFPWRYAWNDLRLFGRVSTKVVWNTVKEGMQIGYRLSRLSGLPEQDVYYAYWGRTDAVVATILATKWNAKCIYRNHRFDLYEERSGPIPFKRALASSESEGLYLSQVAKDYALSRFGHHLASVHPLGINLSQIGTTNSGIAFKPEVAQGVEKDLAVVSVSGISPVKRVSLIPQLLARLSETTGMRLSWLHVGGSASEVAQLALEAGAQLDRSQFEILPFVPNSEIIGILKAKPGAVFINVSISEGVPVSIMEAMASGLAIIATDVGSTKSIVLEPANLLLPGQGSLTEWSELVSGWLRATNLGDTALKNARFAAEKFDHIRNYEALVKHVIHG